MENVRTTAAVNVLCVSNIRGSNKLFSPSEETERSTLFDGALAKYLPGLLLAYTKMEK